MAASGMAVLDFAAGSRLAGAGLYSRRRRRRAADAFVAQAMWSRILPADSLARFWTNCSCASWPLSRVLSHSQARALERNMKT